jgi:hypothetical protein
VDLNPETSPSFVQQGDHLVVRGLREAPVPLTHGHERLRGVEAHDLVALLGETADSFRRRHRDRQHHPGRPLRPCPPQRCRGGPAGGHAVIDHHRRSVPQLHRRPALTVRLRPAPDLLLLLGYLPVQVLAAHPERAEHPLVKDPDPGGHRPQAELRVPRRPDLPGDHEIEGPRVGPGDLGPDLDPSPGDRQHHHVLVAQTLQRPGQLPPCLGPVLEPHPRSSASSPASSSISRRSRSSRIWRRRSGIGREGLGTGFRTRR